MRRLVVLLALLGCRTQPGSRVVVPEVSQPPVAAAESSHARRDVPESPGGDRDADGVPDVADGCPEEPEDRDEFEDEDGCVDRDNDRDGIPDAHEFINGRWTNCDRMIDNGVEIDCRNRPEDRDGERDQDGCPDLLCLSQCSRRLSERVRLDRRGRFGEGAAEVLDEVAAVLKAAPDLQVWVEAHVDERSDDAGAKRLTDRVAAQVIEELVRRGVAREQMEPHGWGDTKPIDRNTTAVGRANNRRVDFFLRLDACCRPISRGSQPAPEATVPDCR